MTLRPLVIASTILITVLLQLTVAAQDKVRARDLGIPFKGETGEHNAITDVPGVEVGYATIVDGSGKLDVGNGPVRTGVTIVLPRGKSFSSYPANYFVFNGDGETTGLPFLDDYGRARGAIAITNTNSVGVVRDAIGEWNIQNYGEEGSAFDFSFGLPIVGETWDGALNDIKGLHVKKEHVFEALKSASSNPPAEGNVGGGTGMICYYFKGGTGTSSRTFTIGSKSYVVGVLVQANFGHRDDLVIAGVPVGEETQGKWTPKINFHQDGSIIVIVGTNAPLSSHLLRLVAKRVTLGLGRTGTIGNNTSGDIFIAFSTARGDYDNETKTTREPSIDKQFLDPVFRGTVEATEEAIINALVAAEDMTGVNDTEVFALPHDEVTKLMKKFNRFVPRDQESDLGDK